MTEERIDELLPRLERKLGIREAEEEVELLLVDELLDAESEVKLYLGVKELEERFLGAVVELAGVFYRRDCAEHPELRSMTYTEGQMSESRSYLTGAEYHQERGEILAGLKRYRRVGCR